MMSFTDIKKYITTGMPEDLQREKRDAMVKREAA